MSKNLDEIVPLQSEKKDKRGYKRYEERNQKRMQKTRVVLPVWPAHQPRRFLGKNECPGTHCSLIVQKERKGSFFQIC